jgi:hypothetical protein
MGDSVQLDDFPYVHMMRRVDEELEKAGEKHLYFPSPDKPFHDPCSWGTLIHLLNEDFEDLLAKKIEKTASAATLLFDRFDRAAAKSGAKARVASLPESSRRRIADALEREARDMLDGKQKGYPDTLEGKTVVIEFARGGPHGASMPLSAPLGYLYSVGELSAKILERAAILYVWVTPEESRRKNRERGDPNDPGSILHHCVPIDVMMNDYGCDDMDWLEANSDRKGTITIPAHGKEFRIPIARFDNRKDKTSFLREDEKRWNPAEVQDIHRSMKEGLDRLMVAWKERNR